MVSSQQYVSKPAWLRYCIALIAVAAGFFLRLALTPFVGEGLPTYITFYPAVVVAALLGGLRPGLLATAVAVVVAHYYVTPRGELIDHGRAVEAIGLILFGLMGIFLSSMIEVYRRLRAKTSAYEKELALRESQQELQRQREWLRVTLASVGDGMLAADADGRITLLNPAAERLTAWTEKEALGQPVSNVLRLVCDDTIEPVEDLVGRALREQRVCSPASNVSLLNRHDRRIPVEPNAAPIMEPGAKVCGVVVVFKDVTGKRQAEHRVLEERDFVSAVLDTAGALVVVMDTEGRIQRFNRACEQTTGYRFDEVKGKAVWDFLIAPEELNSVKTVFEQIRNGQFPNHHENNWICKNGERRRISWSNTGLLDRNGEIQFIIGTGVDLTQQRQLEASFRKAAERHQLALEAGNLGTWNYDFLNGEVFWDERCRTLFGVGSGDHLDYEKVIEIMHEADRQRVHETVQSALTPDSSGAYECEYRVVWPDHSIHWLTAKGQAYFLGEGSQRKPVQLIGTVHDVTNQKQAEAVLRDNQERLQLAQQAGHVGIFDHDFRTNTWVWSDERKVLFGLPQSFVPTEASWLNLVRQADRSALQSEFQRAVAARRQEVDQTYRIIRPDGQERWLQDRAHLTYDESGKPLRMIGTTTDATADIQARDRARQRQEQFRFSAIRTVVILALSLFLVEAGIMSALAWWPSIGPWWSIALDSVTLVVLVSPVLYYFTFRPLVSILQQRQQVEEALRRLNDDLESRVKDRTASLELANRELAAEVAERKKAQAEVSRAKEEWERTFDAVPDLIAILDDRFHVVRANRAMAERLGLSPDQCTGRICHELVHGMACPPGSCPHVRTVADGGEHKGELHEPRLGGDFLITTTPLADDQGRHIGSVHVARDITDLKRAQDTLRKIREDLDHAQAVAHLGSWRLNLQTNVLTWSDETWRIFGLTPGTPLTYDLFLSRVHPEDREFVDRQWQAWLHGEPYDLDHRIVVGDSIKWVHERAEPEPDSQGQLVGGFGTVQDITPLKEAEQKLRQSEALYRAIGESINYGVWVCAPDGRNTYASESFLKLVGLTQEQCSNFGWGNVLHPDDAERTIAAWKECARTGGTWDIEHRYRGTDGQYHDILARGVPVKNERGEIISWAGINLDISRLKNAENALALAHEDLERKVEERTSRLRQSNQRLVAAIRVRREVERRLREAEFRYRTVANFTHDWEYWKTPTGALLYCSPSCERVTGYTATELTADPSLLRRLILPEDLPTWDAHECAAFNEQLVREIQFRIRRKQGDIRWIDHTCREVTGQKGEFLGIRASNRDVTERKLAEMETQRLREELNRFSRITAAGQLAASIAHELTQPLGAALCNSQAAETWLKQQPTQLNEALDALTDIQSDCRRAGAVIQRLRSLFQKGELALVPLQLNDVIRGSLELVHSELVFKDVRIHLDLDPDLPPIMGNLVELQQVILNLVINAIDAMFSQNSQERLLSVRTWSESSETVRASFADSGSGLSPDQLSRIFEPFFSTKASGMGMGLAICHSIIEEHDGRLWAVNNPERGACFHLALPTTSQTHP